MENCNYLIIIAIKQGENFPLIELCENGSSNLVIEARFNNQVLTSDPIAFNDPSPQLRTELAWQIDRKSLHLFRIERRPIKLQVFIDSDNYFDRQLIGYVVLDLRNAQDTLEPKFEWKTLLNPKYKGSAHQRPQISIALVLTKNTDDDCDEHEVDLKDQIDGSEVIDGSDEYDIRLKKSKSIKFAQMNGLEMNGNLSVLGLSKSSSKESFASQFLEHDLNVRLRHGYYHVWDSRHSKESDCHIRYLVSIVIAFCLNIEKLFTDDDQIKSGTPFHFQYSFMGKLLKTEPFDLVNSCDFPMERHTFKIATTDVKMLKAYFELHPCIEIQLCDKHDNLHGFVSIALINFFSKSGHDNVIFKPIQGSFMLLPNDESIEIDDPFPVVGVSLELEKEINSNGQNTKPKEIIDLETIDDSSLDLSPKINKKKKTKTNSDFEKDELINSHENKNQNPSSNIHFCFAIDLRSISLNEMLTSSSSDSNYYLQFSYPFFGVTEPIKTHPTMKLPIDCEVIVPHGFCSFNFATSYYQLEKTLKNIPLVIELIEKLSIDTLIGTAKIDLSKMPQNENESIIHNKKYTTNLNVPVLNEEDKQIGKLQIIMSLENYGSTQIHLVNKSHDVSVLQPFAATSIDQSFSEAKNIDDLLVEAALEIEIWKDKQLTMFKEELKQKELEYTKKFEDRLFSKEKELDKKLKEVGDLESRLKLLLTENEQKKNHLHNQETEVKEMQKELKIKYQKLNEEIANAMSDIKGHYEGQIVGEKSKFKEIESQKRKLQERVYFLERKVKEKEAKLKELEDERLNKPKISIATVSKTLYKPISPCKTASTTIHSQANGSTSSRLSNVNSLRSRSTSVDTRNPLQLFNSTKNPKEISKTVGKEINTKDAKTKPKINDKMESMNILKKRKEELIKLGVSKNDSIIKEIDSKLRKYNLI